MSLFHAREWWLHQLGFNETFSDGALTVGKLSTSSEEASKIITGSLQGRLRVHGPTSRGSDLGTSLLLESQLDAPILQLILLLEHGETNTNSLVVLHPRKLVMYAFGLHRPSRDLCSVSRVKPKMLILHSHQFDQAVPHFIAFSMCSGPYGGRNYDVVLVQSIDGCIIIFDRDAAIFTSRLEDCLLPGPMAYVTHSDAFITCTLALNIKSYKYKMLATSTDNSISTALSTKEATLSLETDLCGKDLALCATRPGAGSKSRRVVADWIFNAGEHILDLKAGRFDNQSTELGSLLGDVLALGQQTIFVLSCTGILKASKLLDFKPTALCVYPQCHIATKPVDLMPVSNATIGPGVFYKPIQECRKGMARGFGAYDNIIVGADDARLLIFSGTLDLLWVARAAQGDRFQAVVISTIEVDVSVVSAYLGTDSLIDNVLPKRNTSQMDREHAARVQYTSLLQQLSSLSAKIESRTFLSAALDATRLVLRVQPHDPVDLKYWKPGVAPSADLPSVPCRIFIFCLGRGFMQNITVTVVAPNWVENSQTLVRLAGGTYLAANPLTIDCKLGCNTSTLPSQMDIKIIVSSIIQDCPSSSSTIFRAPMCLACQVTAPAEQESTYKLTIRTSRETVLLPSLFEDMLRDCNVNCVDAGCPALSFQYRFKDAEPELPFMDFGTASSDPTGRKPTRATATIFISRWPGRYRLQSTSLPALWLALDEFTNRLREHWTNQGGVSLSYDGQVPLADFYNAVDQHYYSRRAAHLAESKLNDCAHQHRIIQKRLLVRFKDSRPAILGHLDYLFRQTQNSLRHFASLVTSAQVSRHRSGHDLECETRLLLSLIRMRLGLSSKEYGVLYSHLSPAVMELNCSTVDSSGWEETTDAAVMYLLKPLSHKRKQKTSRSLLFPAKTDKLKRHVAMLCEQLERDVA